MLIVTNNMTRFFLAQMQQSWSNLLHNSFLAWFNRPVISNLTVRDALLAYPKTIVPVTKHE